jgi:DNA polymerase I-like protein with 3'-5' exonuclease and polymerase domains
MSVDREYVTTKRKEYGDRIYKLKSRIGKLVGQEFNPQSHQQVLHALKERGFVVSSTSKSTLAELEDELAGLIVELREANKIKATYFDALHEEAKDGVLHPNFRQHGTRTGRMSSGSAEA